MTNEPTNHQKDNISIVLAGEAGMGIQTVEKLLTGIFKFSGYHVFASKEYMSRIRGGSNSTELRISSRQIRAFINRIDILIPLDKSAARHVQKRISDGTLILAEHDYFADSPEQSCGKYVNVPFGEIAAELGNKLYSNIVAAGLITGLLGIESRPINDYMKRYFVGKAQELVEGNLKAAAAGYQIGADLAISSNFSVDICSNPSVEQQILLSGAEAVGLGALAGGCNYISSYPMSPGTGVLTFLAGCGAEFGVIVEQAEDEIAAINMALGASYAGARSMVTTSGGGFALMSEGVSLAGMLETPTVIHLAQRPGPATGLPTRTEQGDLELALYAGHGEFPRVIFAPGNIDEAFSLTQTAFNLAAKYQIPVFVLTDQYLMDSRYNTNAFDLSDIKVEKHIVKTQQDYRRYELTEGGISPRGVPGWGDGLVCVDSDEHDVEGHITEDLSLREVMVDKRLAKLKQIQDEAVLPELYPQGDYKNLVVCWGSTCNIVKEALDELGREDAAMLHFKQVYPLHPEAADYLKRAKRTILLENNATGQFGKLIKLHAGIDMDERILKYNGLCFAVDELVERLEKILG